MEIIVKKGHKSWPNEKRFINKMKEREKYVRRTLCVFIKSKWFQREKSKLEKILLLPQICYFLIAAPVVISTKRISCGVPRKYFIQYCIWCSTLSLNSVQLNYFRIVSAFIFDGTDERDNSSSGYYHPNSHLTVWYGCNFMCVCVFF